MTGTGDRDPSYRPTRRLHRELRRLAREDWAKRRAMRQAALQQA